MGRRSVFRCFPDFFSFHLHADFACWLLERANAHPEWFTILLLLRLALLFIGLLYIVLFSFGCVIICGNGLQLDAPKRTKRKEEVRGEEEGGGEGWSCSESDLFL